MSADKEYTYAEVSQHATKKDLLVVIHDNIYNASSFIDEHPYVHQRRRPSLFSATMLAACPLTCNLAPLARQRPKTSQSNS